MGNDCTDGQLRTVLPTHNGRCLTEIGLIARMIENVREKVPYYNMSILSYGIVRLNYMNNKDISRLPDRMNPTNFLLSLQILPPSAAALARCSLPEFRRLILLISALN